MSNAQLDMSTIPFGIADIEAARQRIKGAAIRTPLVRLNVSDAPAEIYLKLENLQPIGSFKLRGAANAMRMATPEQLKNGVFTGSAGNMAQGVAWTAQQMGIASTAIVPEHAPETKLAAIKRYDGNVIKVPFDEWWTVMVSHQYTGQNGLFVHPVSDAGVMAGNGTIGLEILEDLPDVDAIVVPYGGGGLSCGIATATRARKPDTRLYAGEVETSAAFAGALAAGERTTIKYQPSFVDGIGSSGVLEEMWPIARALLDDSIVMSLDDVAESVRILAERNRVIAEGAGATAVAAALSGRAGGGKVVCVVSGGNIDILKFTQILRRELHA